MLLLIKLINKPSINVLIITETLYRCLISPLGNSKSPPRPISRERTTLALCLIQNQNSLHQTMLPYQLYVNRRWKHFSQISRFIVSKPLYSRVEFTWLCHLLLYGPPLLASHMVGMEGAMLWNGQGSGAWSAGFPPPPVWHSSRVLFFSDAYNNIQHIPLSIQWKECVCLHKYLRNPTSDTQQTTGKTWQAVCQRRLNK